MKTSTTLAALAALSADLATATPRRDCCRALSQKSSLISKVWTPDQERYDNRLGEYYSTNAAQAPWCMVFPESTQDVSDIVNVLREKSCPFGMRSGAHAAFEGSNSIKEGVTVDFGHLNATTYDESAKVASIQPGSTWGPVYETLAPYDVVAIGGRADIVGVGGFTTGGGYSFHTGVRGFACDSVVNFEVVLGDGSIVNANATDNKDLWQALKGGSGNFGFVTRIDQEVWPSATIYANLNTFELHKRSDLSKAFIEFVHAQDDEPESQLIHSMIYSGGKWDNVNVMSNIKGEISPAFDSFFDLEPQSSLPATGPAHEVVPIFQGPTPLGLYANWQSGMLSLDLEVMDATDKIVFAAMEKMQAAAPNATLEMIWQFQPITQGIVDTMNERGGNIMGLDAIVADGPAIMYNIVLTVDTAANQDIVLPMALQMNKDILAKADEMGGNRHWTFVNYAHGSQDPLAEYGEDSLALIREVSKKFDKHQVFQKLRGTGFHIPSDSQL